MRELATNEPAQGAFLKAWHSRSEVFGPRTTDAHAHSASAGPFDMGGGQNNASGMQSGEAEVLISAHYNEAAFHHIRDHALQHPSTLERLRRIGPTGAPPDHQRSVPSFPVGAAVALAAWWPVAMDGLTPMPVWDPATNPAHPQGNGYASWRRIVAVDPAPKQMTWSAAPLVFLGRQFSRLDRVSLSRFRTAPVDALSAAALMRNSQARKAALIALGRPLEGGDRLALVGLHLAVKTPAGWVWSTLWWHDHPADGAFATGRPQSIPEPWNNYLLDAVAGQDLPDASGSLRPCFNPWFEARFPDGGGGGGVDSNCAGCHRRATYPAVTFLPIRRSSSPREADPAFAPDRVQTDSMWAIARHGAGGAPTMSGASSGEAAQSQNRAGIRALTP